MTRKVILITICLVVLLAGCGQAAPQAPAATSAPAAQAPTAAPAAPDGAISFMVFGDPAEKAAYATLVDAFKQRNPQIDVQLVHIPAQGDYLTRLGADFAAGTPADIILVNYRRFAGFAVKGALEPLGPYLAKSSVVSEGDFYQEAIKAFYWNGTLTCIPQNVSSLVVYYNKNLFDQAGVAYPQAGWSWDDFLKAAQALTKDTNGDGATDQYGVGTELEAIRLAPFVWQNGGEIVDDPAKPTRLALDTPAATEAFQWFVDLQVKHHVAPDATQDQAEDSESRFMNGRLGMLLNSRRGVPTYREIKGFEWDVGPLPQGKQPVTILHSDAYCMTAASKNKPAAWAFVEFANSAEGQTIIAKTGRTVPSLKAVANSPAFLDSNSLPKSSQVFLDVIPHIRSLPTMAAWADIEEVLTEELQRAFYGQAPVSEAISAAATNSAPFFSR
ncbi:MAG: sugar ABC transporter substrate-binding protein [Kouleothrix sp.]|nr:sugar ABC transporter substrate-binding protein [Kouleothrix sp.]